MESEYRICRRCVMDTSDPGIEFDQEGICNRCKDADKRMQEQLLPAAERQHTLEELVEVVKRDGKGQDYDCIVGVSGGVDSTTVAYYTKQLGLRPLAVHFDNGWNSELAVGNIKNTLSVLGVDLYTYVVDWEEFRDLQMSFIKADVVNCESPTDHGIHATLFRAASREGVRFILSGSNLVTESIMPYEWSYYHQDLKNLQAIHKRFGTVRLATFPTISMGHYLYYVLAQGIRQIPFLNYFDYNKEEAKKMLEREIGWRDYGGKHYESVWTRFYQGYYLPVKFGFDKRKAHLSTMICSGQITRAQALAELEKPTYDEKLLQEDMEFVIKKFGLSQQEFQAILKAPPKLHTDYPSNNFWFHRLRWLKNQFRKIATSV